MCLKFHPTLELRCHINGDLPKPRNLELPMKLAMPVKSVGGREKNTTEKKILAPQRQPRHPENLIASTVRQLLRDSFGLVCLNSGWIPHQESKSFLASGLCVLLKILLWDLNLIPLF